MLGFADAANKWLAKHSKPGALQSRKPAKNADLASKEIQPRNDCPLPRHVLPHHQRVHIKAQ